MKKLMFLLTMLAVQFATFAENESGSEHFGRDELEWGESDGFQIHWGIKHKDRSARKKYSLEPGYRSFVSGEILMCEYPAFRISTTHGMQLDNRFFIGAGLGLLSSEYAMSDCFSIPFFSEFRVDFLKKRISPFLEVRGGYDLVINAESGFYGGLSMGCRLKRISMSFGAEIMPENSCVIDTFEGSDISDEEMYNYGGWNFNLRFSYEFSKHRK